MKSVLKKYEDFKAACGDLLDPSECRVGMIALHV